MGAIESVSGSYDWTGNAASCQQKAGGPCRCYVYRPGEGENAKEWKREECSDDILREFGAEFRTENPTTVEPDGSTVLVHWGPDGARLYLQRDEQRNPVAVVVVWPTNRDDQPPETVVGAFLRRREFLRLCANELRLRRMHNGDRHRDLVSDPNFRALQQDAEFLGILGNPPVIDLMHSLASALLLGPLCGVCLERAGDLPLPCACGRANGLCQSCVSRLAPNSWFRCPFCRQTIHHDPSIRKLSLLRPAAAPRRPTAAAAVPAPVAAEALAAAANHPWWAHVTPSVGASLAALATALGTQLLWDALTHGTLQTGAVQASPVAATVPPPRAARVAVRRPSAVTPRIEASPALSEPEELQRVVTSAMQDSRHPMNMKPFESVTQYQMRLLSTLYREDVPSRRAPYEEFSQRLRYQLFGGNDRPPTLADWNPFVVTEDVANALLDEAERSGHDDLDQHSELMERLRHHLLRLPRPELTRRLRSILDRHAGDNV